jgi:hypothetical protein
MQVVVTWQETSAELLYMYGEDFIATPKKFSIFFMVKIAKMLTNFRYSSKFFSKFGGEMTMTSPLVCNTWEGLKVEFIGNFVPMATNSSNFKEECALRLGRKNCYLSNNISGMT